MASKRAVLPVAGLLAALTGLTLSGGQAHANAQVPARPKPAVEVIGLPQSEAKSLFSRLPMRLAVGVFPNSRQWERFLAEIGYGAPAEAGKNEAVRGARFARVIQEVGFSAGDSGAIRPTRSDRILGYLLGSLAHAGIGYSSAQPASMDPAAAGVQEQLPQTVPPRPLAFRAYETADEVERHIRTQPAATVMVLGLGERTPLWIGLCDQACVSSPGTAAPGILTGSITRRPGIVTPYDVAVTILDRMGFDPIPEGLAGNRLTSEPDPNAAGRIDALARRLQRDDSYAPGLAAVAVGTGGLLVIIGWFLSKAGRSALALRAAQAAVFVLPGWVLAEFIPSSAWGVRAVPVFAGALLGGAMKPRTPARTLARVGFGSAAAFAVLVAIAPLNPGGEPGLSIWGNPLVSWRFFGMQNVQAAIIASGVVVWGVLAGIAAPALAAVALGAAVVTGAPMIGANFVGVLTFVFGSAIAITALARRRVSLRLLLGSGVIAVGAFVLALLADAGSPVSHGGRAARRISNDGWSAAWDLIEGRLRLNVELIRDFSGGWIFVALLLATMAAMIAWSLRENGPFRGRIAVLAGALMALTSLVLEDSGFYSGAVLWFVAADAWLLVTLVERSGVTPQRTAAPTGADG